MIFLYRHGFIFYFLSTLIPWTCWFGAAWMSHDRLSMSPLASLLAIVGLCAPMGIAMILIVSDPALRRDFMYRLYNWRAPIRYYLLACGLMPLTIVLAIAVSLPFGYSSQQFTMNMQFSFTSGMFPVWLILIVAPIMEELGWHSYGTDCLRCRYNLFTTSLLFSVFWGIWHIPLSAIPDYYHNELVVTGLIYGINFLLSIVPFVFLMNWLYYKTGRNIFVSIVFHITAGLFNELFCPHPDSKIIQTGILMVITLVVLLIDEDFFFKRSYLEC